MAGTTIAAALAGCSGGESTDTTDVTGEPDPTAAPSGANGESPYTGVYRDIVSSVVLIRNPEGSLGTGFVFDDETVVTNAHVVGTADRVELTYSEDDSQVATVLGRDSLSDLAAIEAADRPDYAAPLALSEGEPTIGTEVAVVGSPFGLQNSLTTGVVSATNRLIPNRKSNFLLPNAIQTDAAVNPGNSGGPLVDLAGNVLGVINSGRGDNIAFAISPPLVDRVVPTLAEEGEYVHPYLGARVRRVTDTIARARGLDEPRGALVTAVQSGSPAEGVLQANDETRRVDGYPIPAGGDIVLSIDGGATGTRQAYYEQLFLNTSPGDTVTVEFVRDGDRREAEVTLAGREGE